MLEHSTTLTVRIGDDVREQRLDSALAAATGGDVPRLSRTRIRRLIDAGCVQDTEAPERRLTPAESVRSGQCFTLRLPAPPPAALQPEPMELEIVYEDAEILVVNKAAGLLVHPAGSIRSGTLVNGLLAHCGDRLSATGGPLRPGIVHRIDRGTSGLLVVARTDSAHATLADRFAAHAIEREYLAIVRGTPDPAEPRFANAPGVTPESGGWFRIEAAIASRPGSRAPWAVDSRRGRRAVTRIRAVAVAGRGDAAVASLLRCRLETGRTHQIRVHLTHLGHPLIGDPEYGRADPISPRFLDAGGRAAIAGFSRPALHAAHLGFAHPVSGELLRFSAPPPDDFKGLAETLRLDLP